MQSVSLRKAVYDEFDGKGVAIIFATLIVYYMVVAKEGQTNEENVKLIVTKKFSKNFCVFIEDECTKCFMFLCFLEIQTVKYQENVYFLIVTKLIFDAITQC